MFCPQCGTRNPDGAKFCTSCGAPLARPEAQGTQPGAAPAQPSPGQPAAAPGSSTQGAHAAQPGSTAADYASRRRSPIANKGLIIMGGGALVVLVVVGIVVYNLFFAPYGIDEKNFPDIAVRNVVAARLDTNHDGKLGRDEGKAVTELDVSGAASFTGMGKYFPNLTSLTLEGSALSSADISDLGKLESFDARGTSIQSLDVSKNGKLSSLGLEPSVTVEGLDKTGLREVWLPDTLTASYWSDSDGGDWYQFYQQKATYDLDGTVTKLEGFNNDSSSASSQPSWESNGSNTFTYNNGRPESSVSETASGSTYDIAYTYDDAGRLTEVANDDGDSFAYTYDDAGRLTGIDAGSDSIGYTFAYDDQGRISALGERYSDSTYPWQAAYDDAGRLTSLTQQNEYGNGSYAYAYDDQGRLSTITYTTGGSSSSYTYTTSYTYNDAGRISGVETVDSSNDSYDWSISYNDQGLPTHAELMETYSGTTQNENAFDVTYGARVFVAKDAADPAPGFSLIETHDPSYLSTAISYLNYSPAMTGLSDMPEAIQLYVKTHLYSSYLY